MTAATMLLLLSLLAAASCSGFMEDLCPNLGCFSQVFGGFFGGALERAFTKCLLTIMQGTIFGILSAGSLAHTFWESRLYTCPTSNNLAILLSKSLMSRLNGG